MINESKNKKGALGRPIGFSIVNSERGWISERADEFGKWIIRDENPENLKKHKEKLNELVEKGKLAQIKFYNVKRMNEEGISLLPERDASVLMFYCYKNEKEKVKKIIEDLGLSPEEWKSNKQTAEDWQPGGKLFEEMKESLPEKKFKIINNRNYVQK